MTAHLDLLRRVTELEAENERLRGYSDALKGQRDRAEDRARVLEAALAEMGNAMEAGAYDAAWVIRNAALTEPTPPQEEPR